MFSVSAGEQSVSNTKVKSKCPHVSFNTDNCEERSMFIVFLSSFNAFIFLDFSDSAKSFKKSTLCCFLKADCDVTGITKYLKMSLFEAEKHSERIQKKNALKLF